MRMLQYRQLSPAPMAKLISVSQILPQRCDFKHPSIDEGKISHHDQRCHLGTWVQFDIGHSALTFSDPYLKIEG